MSKFWLSALALSLVLGGCASGAAFLNNRALSPQLQANSLRSPQSTPELMLEPARMEALASVLTGFKPMPDGITIPERGTTQGRDLTRKFIISVLESYGYKPELHNYRSSGSNILVHLPAEQPTDEFVLVGAHMDSVRNAGADDNNSGSVAVLEAARVLKNLQGRKVNLIFAWFDEEELGLVGSRFLAKEYKKQGKKLTSVHTLDMVGWDGDKDRVVEIEQPDGPLWDYYQMVNKSHQLNLKLSRTSAGDTDHVAFRNEGFTSVGLCEEWIGGDTTPHYHRRTDAYTTLDFGYLHKVNQLMVAVVSDLVRGVPAPLVQTRIPHDRFPTKARPFHASYDDFKP
ncbi:MAG: Zn-dependent exopeptidase M28 [Candidatus Sericytochromatia bacterium]|nr:Zn-dependent exopeptidase M28 [Candidatus Sericytochromatia bacterium]